MAGGDGTNYLHISDSMARDLDAGRADNRPVEDFIPDHVLQEMKDAQQASAVVHGEDLVPISRSDAARRMTFDGATLPKAPSTRRVIPAPYKRDRVIGGKHGKKWREMPAGKIEKGDIIPDIGLVRFVTEEVRHEGEGRLGPVAVGTDIYVVGISGSMGKFDARETVRVFR